MRPNLGGEGRDPRQLGQCSNFNRIWVLKASLNNNYLFCLYLFFCELKFIQKYTFATIILFVHSHFKSIKIIGKNIQKSSLKKS